MITKEIISTSELLELVEGTCLNNLDAYILNNLLVVDLPVKHSFTEGLYAREISMPKGTLLTSKIHKTEHPYVVLTGCARVFIPGKGIEVLKAGHSSVTEPGTRRALFIEEDCKWVTFHPLSYHEEESRKFGVSEKELLTMIEERIIEKKEIPELNGFTMNDIYKAFLEEQSEGGDLCLGR